MGNGILEGLKSAKGEVLSWTHADLQTDPKDVIRAYQTFMEHNADDVIVKGRRQNRALLESFFTFAMQVISSMALKVMLYAC